MLNNDKIKVSLQDKGILGEQIMPKSSKAERILILCVDRDDDLGMKAGLNTPILGRKDNVNAAAGLALRDPEEPDANAMFEAVRIYDNLKKGAKEKEEHEVATIAGSDLGGVEADRQLVDELTEVLKTFQATDVILVTDGYTDEMVLPLIESRVPVTSVRRIVMKHSKSIEETAAVFSRYMKILVENPRYSRLLLGLPGILFIVLAVLALIPKGLEYAIPALGVIAGAFLVIRGFKLDKRFFDFIKWVREYSPPPFTVQIAGFSAVAGILLILVGGYLGGTAVARASAGVDPLSIVPRLIGEFLSGPTYVIAPTYLIAIGICVILSGRAIRWFVERDLRLLRTIVIMVVVAWSSVMFVQASTILINPIDPVSVLAELLPLLYAIIGGIPVIVSTVLTVLVLRRKYSNFFKESEEASEDLEEG
jgi:putative membrane protein